MTWQSEATLAVTFLAAVCDFRSGKVPNQLTYTAVGIALLLSLLIPPRDFAGSLIGLAGTLAVYLVLHVFAGLGAGDAKLMAAVGALKGFSFSLYSSFYILCAGFAVAVAVLAWKGCLLDSFRWALSMLVGGIYPRARGGARGVRLHTIPFAPVIFVGVAWTIWLECTHGPITLRFPN
jgi:prepilin peptidase CpaA